LGLGFGVQGLGFRVGGLGFWVLGFKFTPECGPPMPNESATAADAGMNGGGV
jgi:hypothetical protein